MQKAESYGMGLANAFGYQHSVEEEASFSLVDRGTTSTKKTGFASRSRVNNEFNEETALLMDFSFIFILFYFLHLNFIIIYSKTIWYYGFFR